MAKWAYRLEVGELNFYDEHTVVKAVGELNDSGRDGWEAISFTPILRKETIFWFALLKRAY